MRRTAPVEPARIDLALHPKQAVALTTAATEVLYGGAAGGGKSHLMRAAAILWATAIAGLQIYLFRRKLPDLLKNHMEGPKGYRNLLAPWVAAGFVEIVEGVVRFWNGSRIYLCHCQHDKDRFNYAGAEIHVLLVDELTHFSEPIYRFLRGRVRAVGLPELPAGYAGRFPRVLCGSNPGGPGHHWVKAAFVDGAAPMELRHMPDPEGGMLRQYIPARLDDNPAMADDDPEYRARLRGLGSAALVQAMENGDWNVVEGAYFDCWSTARHVIRPFAIPDWWTRFRSFDWGSASPFSVGWWAVAGEDTPHPDSAVIPRGALIRTREWYGAHGQNLGLKLSNVQIAEGIAARDGGERFAYGVADPSIFRTDGGPSIAEQMSRRGIVWRRADNRRVPGIGPISGWDQMRQRFIGDEAGRPMIFCFDTCADSIRTIPALQHDAANPEDVDTGGEDHAADEWRYACMSRPWARPRPAPAVAPPRLPTFREMMERQRRNREDES